MGQFHKGKYNSSAHSLDLDLKTYVFITGWKCVYYEVDHPRTLIFRWWTNWKSYGQEFSRNHRIPISIPEPYRSDAINHNKSHQKKIKSCWNHFFLGYLKTGAIVGIVAGVIGGIVLVGLVAFFVLKLKKKKKKGKGTTVTQI